VSPSASLSLALGIAAAVTVLVGVFPAISTYFSEATRALLALGG